MFAPFGGGNDVILYADPARILRGRPNFPSAPPVFHIPTRPSSPETGCFVVLDSASLHHIALAIGCDIAIAELWDGGVICGLDELALTADRYWP